MKASQSGRVVSWKDTEDACGCTSCGERLTGAAATQQEPPKQDDVSLCVYCGAINIFTGKGLELRAPTQEEKLTAEGDPDVMLARILIEQIQDRLPMRPKEGQNRARGSGRT